jgi:glycosyltransferase involved in cell wall biosynthesis
MKKEKDELVSIVVVNYNTKELIKLVIDSIIHYTDYKNYEILIVDNGSTDGSLDLLDKLSRSKNIRLIKHNQKKSIGSMAHSRALDLGVSLAKGKFILTLDADSFPIKKGWLKELIKLYNSDKKIRIVGAKRGDYVHPSCLLIKKKTILKNNLSFMPENNFDTGLYMSYFLVKKGFKKRLLPKTKENIKFGKIYGDLICHLWGATNIKFKEMSKWIESYDIIEVSDPKQKVQRQKDIIINAVNYYNNKLKNIT